MKNKKLYIGMLVALIIIVAWWWKHEDNSLPEKTYITTSEFNGNPILVLHFDYYCKECKEPFIYDISKCLSFGTDPRMRLCTKCISQRQAEEILRLNKIKKENQQQEK